MRYISLFAFLVATLPALCQRISSTYTTYYNGVKTNWGVSNATIYEEGLPLTSCEMNFKNLMANWNESIVTNASEYEIISYSFVGTVPSKDSLEWFCEQFIGDDYLTSRTGGHTNFTTNRFSTDEIRVQTINVHYASARLQKSDTSTYTDLMREQRLADWQYQLNQIKKTLWLKIAPGDSIYSLNFKDYRNVEYSTSVICNSLTKRVVWDPVFSPLTIEKRWKIE